MDVEKTLRELYAEKRALDSAIASLEKRLTAGSRGGAPKKRGRKSMSAQERRAVSERMRRYWENRRKQMRELDSASDNSAEAAAG
ncbi:MAG TPA: hypothetical protein VKG79_08100 [Bryobacteraceae bacterium]|nr:hypothetical protein [Bryobacteraceae bacterium]